MNVDLEQEVISELRSVAKRMKEELDPFKKLFYFSAAYGIVNRTMRFDFSREFLLIDYVLTGSYNLLLARGQAIAQGDKVVPLPVETLNEVADLVTELAARIEANESCCEILQKILLIAFQSTGPGHYMAVTGKIK